MKSICEEPPLPRSSETQPKMFGGKKSTVVSQPPKAIPPVGEDSQNVPSIIGLEEGWEQIKKTGVDPFIALIQEGQDEFFNASKFVQLYDVIFRMCIQREPHNWSRELYERYGRSIRDYLQDQVLSELTAARQKNDITFLQTWCKVWRNHDRVVKGLSKLFMYLDRFYTAHTTPRPLSLQQLGYLHFEEIIFDSFAMHARAAILDAVGKEREKEQQDQHLLQESVQVFVELGRRREKKLGFYKAALEEPLLDQTRVFYLRRGKHWMETDSCPAYLRKVEEALNQEAIRVTSYLHPTTDGPIHQVVRSVLLMQPLQEILRKETGLEHLLTTAAVDDLARLYNLVSEDDPESEDLQPVADMMREYVRRAGTELVNQAAQNRPAAATAPATAARSGGGKARPGAGGGGSSSSEQTLVEELVALHSRMHRIVEGSFRNAVLFQKQLHLAFEDFINRDSRVSRHLAKFMHSLLKKGSRVKVEDKDETLKNAVFLYGHIRDKDVFELDYQGFLGERLLENRYESEHDEKKVIAMLKSQCGYQWANKLEGMFKDIQVSKDLLQQFRDTYSEILRGSELELEVNVCTQGYWPQSEEHQQGGRRREEPSGPASGTSSSLPEQLQSLGNRFNTFYLNQHSGRRLQWQMHQGRAECKITFRPGVEKTLVVTTYQMLILLGFNEKKILTFPELLQMTGIPEGQIPNHLLSLCHPKVGVLMKRPGGVELNEQCKFMINSKYNNALLKIVIPLLKLARPAKKAELPDVILTQRRCMTDAAIVRIMKTRRELRHNLLVVEVIQQLQARFDVKPKYIKERIEHLMDEYISRSPDDRSVYLYKM